MDNLELVFGTAGLGVGGYVVGRLVKFIYAKYYLSSDCHRNLQGGLEATIVTGLNPPTPTGSTPALAPFPDPQGRVGAPPTSIDLESQIELVVTNPLSTVSNIALPK
jgi:hypothetical protein